MADDWIGFAPAKLNLALHVTGKRDDGYHLLDSLVVFVGVGDNVRVQPSDDLTLTIEGPRADGVPSGDDNLIIRAARCLSADKGAKITLHKVLPMASGLGGGSSDAAAALRGLVQIWGEPDDGFAERLTAIGADIPVCLSATPARMRGIGEILSDIPPLPQVFAVLVNPGQELSTARVFAALERTDFEPLPDQLREFPNAAALAQFVASARNDLQAPALSLLPEIEAVLKALEGPGSLVARMSGSGASCFALFEDEGAAKAQARQIKSDHPDWWVAGGMILPDGAAAMPRQA